MLACSTPIFQFQINSLSSSASLLQVVMPRKSPQNSCLLFPNEGHREPSRRRTPPLAESGGGWPVDRVHTSTLQKKKTPRK